ncbi:MAG: hypothetical protein ACRDDY_02640 [Clostridium sp.]
MVDRLEHLKHNGKIDIERSLLNIFNKRVSKELNKKLEGVK